MGDFEMAVEEDHVTQLIKGLVDTYVRTRLYNHSNLDTMEEQETVKHHKLMKLILFNNQ